MASRKPATLGLIALLTLTSHAWGQSETKTDTAKTDSNTSSEPTKDDTKDKTPSLEKATFGGGCFWCMEAVFERVPGVKKVVSGYAGGRGPRPTYEAVHTGTTGYAEVVQITFDPSVIAYDELLTVFWHSHDPTSLNRQGPDFGTQYRSVIFYHSEKQKEEARKSYQEITRRREFIRPIMTDLEPMTRFWPAENYHQNYYRRNRAAPYCTMNIDPKMVKLRYILQELQNQRDTKAKAKETAGENSNPSEAKASSETPR
jgi:peptide-methionine (S)-S-oxide reductase